MIDFNRLTIFGWLKWFVYLMHNKFESLQTQNHINWLETVNTFFINRYMLKWNSFMYINKVFNDQISSEIKGDLNFWRVHFHDMWKKNEI